MYVWVDGVVVGVALYESKESTGISWGCVSTDTVVQSRSCVGDTEVGWEVMTWAWLSF